MRAELFRPEAPDEIVAVLDWNDGEPVIQTGADLAGISALLRATPVQVDDASLRHMGTNGPSVLMPGSVAWFRAAITTRAAASGYSVRFATGEVRGGWDPASAYRHFKDQAERLETRT